MKSVMLIVNPNSGKSKPKSMLFDVIQTLSDAQCIVTTRITSAQGDAAEFARSACNSRTYDLIICCGGDGTLSETISGVLMSENNVPVGYIPCGSTNDYARSLNISSDHIKAANVAANGEEYPVDIGIINGRYFNYIASFGLFTSVSYNASRSLKSMLGHTAYVLEGTKELTKIKPNHVKIKTENTVYEDDYIFGAIANSTSIGGIVKLSETLVSFNDGVFEICLVKMPKNPADIVKIVRGIMNSDFTDDCFEFFRASSLEISAPDDMPWSLDGEKAEPGSDITVDIIHSAVKLMM